MASCAVEWKDVHLDHELVKELGAELEFVRECLHVVDENGRLRVGYDAFIAIWRNSPNEKWKARLSSLPYRWNRLMKHW